MKQQNTMHTKGLAVVQKQVSQLQKRYELEVGTVKSSWAQAEERHQQEQQSLQQQNGKQNINIQFLCLHIQHGNP